VEGGKIVAVVYFVKKKNNFGNMKKKSCMSTVYPFSFNLSIKYDKSKTPERTVAVVVVGE